MFKANDNDVIDDGGDAEANGTVVNLSKNEKSKNLTYMSNIGATGEPNFLTPDAKKGF